MKSKTTLALKALYTLLFIGISILSNAGSSVNFIKGSWSDAVAQSKQTGKPIFLDCYTTWCGPCKRMDKEAFVNKAVAKYYNEHFINVKIDMETEEGIKLQEKYNVNAYPTLLYIDSEEQLLHRATGYRYGAAKSLIKIGKHALNKNKRSEKLAFEYAKGNKAPKFSLKYTKQLTENRIIKPEVFDDYLNTLDTNKLGSSKTRKLIYQHISSSNSLAYSLIVKHEFYPETMLENYTLLNCFITDSRTAARINNDSMYFEIINKAYSIIPTMQQQINMYVTAPYYSSTNQLNILHDSTKNYVENYVLDSMTGRRFIMEIRDHATPTPYNKNEYASFYSYFSEDGEKPHLYELDYNATAWKLYEACGIYIKTIKDTSALKDAKLWMEIALTIEEVPQYLDTYAYILYNLGMIDETLDVLNRLRVLLEQHPEYGQYDEAMKLREKLYKERDK